MFVLHNVFVEFDRHSIDGLVVSTFEFSSVAPTTTSTQVICKNLQHMYDFFTMPQNGLNKFAYSQLM